MCERPGSADDRDRGDGVYPVVVGGEHDKGERHNRVDQNQPSLGRRADPNDAECDEHGATLTGKWTPM